MQDFIARLIEESKRFLNSRAQIDDDIGQEAAKFVAREIPAPSGTFEKSDSPLIRWIEEAIQFGSPETERVLNALKPALGRNLRARSTVSRRAFLFRVYASRKEYLVSGALSPCHGTLCGAFGPCRLDIRRRFKSPRSGRIYSAPVESCAFDADK